MGVWGAENFGNDAACDFRENAVVKPMTSQLRRIVENPALADPEEQASFEVMAAVEILVLLCENVKACPPPSQLVKDCCDLCLRGWDEGIDKLHPKPGYKEERRAVIVATFEKPSSTLSIGWRCNGKTKRNKKGLKKIKWDEIEPEHTGGQVTCYA